jgi:hypothetical protein
VYFASRHKNTSNNYKFKLLLSDMEFNTIVVLNFYDLYNLVLGIHLFRISLDWNVTPSFGVQFSDGGIPQPERESQTQLK